jgi:zinc transport system ATP-binding protein
MSDPGVYIENLSVKFGDFYALHNITVQIPENSFVAIVGPNGAGKTTLLKVLLGLIPTYTGAVRLFERSIRDVPPHWIGYVPQFKTMDRRFPALSIELVLTGINRTWPWRWRGTNYDQAQAALDQVGAAHLADRPISRLSGGELQRVCLARSIVRQPKLVMLDEPATGIDTVGEADMYKQLESYQENSGATVIMITHDWHAATHHADYVLLLNRKQISFGPPVKALNEKDMREAFGHIGHEHKVKFLLNRNE